MKIYNLISCVAVSLLVYPAAAKPVHAHARSTSNQRLLNTVMRLAEAEFHSPNSKLPADFDVRRAGFYAVGLLLRNAPTDNARAATVITEILDQQYALDGSAWAGSFRHTPLEPMPPPAAKAYKDYDPNWREFVGCTLALLVDRYGSRLPAQLVQRMEQAIATAVHGERAAHRLTPAYTNIALMYGFLLDFHAARTQAPADTSDATAWADAITALWAPTRTFAEYNSPTYYGVDLFALALWRDFGSTAHLRLLGAQMEDGLWQDIADLYNPTLHNLCGPFDRTYGMDMEGYVSQVGLWIYIARNAPDNALPALDPGTALITEAAYAPLFVVLGSGMSAALKPRFEELSTGRLTQHELTGGRRRTAYIGPNISFGGENSAGAKDATANAGQFAAATVQWRTPSCAVGWIRLVGGSAVDATATADGLRITSTGPVTFEIFSAASSALTADSWQLDGLTVKVSHEGRTFSTGISDTSGHREVIYAGTTSLQIQLPTALSSSACNSQLQPRKPFIHTHALPV